MRRVGLTLLLAGAALWCAAAAASARSSVVLQRVGRFAQPDYLPKSVAVNILGSFVVGLIMALSLERGMMQANVRILLTIGLCGGFTTMSTFSYETVALMRDGETMLALSNIAATMGSCLAAAWVGQTVGRGSSTLSLSPDGVGGSSVIHNVPQRPTT